jgi:segregation and condensation protein B
MESMDKLKSIIEALLMVSEQGLSREELNNAIEEADMKDIEESIQVLKEEYASSGRAFNIAEIAGKCRIVTKPEYMPWIGNLYQKDIDRLTGPSLETLAIIAYKQPVTRAEVEGIRGVNVGGVLQTLLDKELIQVKGRKDVIGRPLVYGTAEKFLEIFGLNSLADLPLLRDFSAADLEYGKPQEVVENKEAGAGEEAAEEQAGDDVQQGTQDVGAEPSEGSSHEEKTE